MKKNICVFISLLAASFCNLKVTYAEAPPIEWQKTFGGIYNDIGRSVQQTRDGGYIIAGTTCSFYEDGRPGPYPRRVYLIKTDPNGNLQWQQTVGQEEFTIGYSVQQTIDGGYIIAGIKVWSDPWVSYAGLVKTDPNGNYEWDVSYDESESYGYSVQQTTDGGYIIAGKTIPYGAEDYDVYLIKTDSNGNSDWDSDQHSFGGWYDDCGYSVWQTNDGGYIITGETYSFGAGDSDVYLVKTDSEGTLRWQKTFGASADDWGESVLQTTDGGYIIAGTTSSFGEGGMDVYLVKTDLAGRLQWQKTFGGSDNDLGHSVHQTDDGGYVIAGQTYSYGAGLWNVYLIKTDPNGNLLWEMTFGGSDQDRGYSVQQTNDGGYIIAGETYSFGTGDSDVYLIKVCGVPVIPGDITADGKVDFEDLAVLIAHWLEGTTP
jgi:hypothetical protein